MYYEVQLPEEYGLTNKPMFFSKVRVVKNKKLLVPHSPSSLHPQEWAIGRVIDFVAEKFKLRNENNKHYTQVRTNKNNNNNACMYKSCSSDLTFT